MLPSRKRLTAVMSPTYWLTSRTHHGNIPVRYGHHTDQVVQEIPVSYNLFSF